jgi:hypothetical protein
MIIEFKNSYERRVLKFVFYIGSLFISVFIIGSK